jgi:tRNA1Val (adenine37-N6)-methyltransferase
MSEPLTTTDTFYHGKVVIKQLKKGYRFAVDSPILADFLPVSEAPALEVGCGVGVISLLALYQKKFPAVTGIEIQETLYRLAVDNAAANGLSGRFNVIHGDFKRIHAGITCVQTIFCNPPFFKAGQGHVSPDRTIRRARFEIFLTLADLLRGCAAILAARGNLCLIFPFARQSELLAEAAAHGLYPVELRPVQPFADSAPDRFLVQLKKTARTCKLKEPLVIFQGKGVYTREMEPILAGEGPASQGRIKG